MGTTNVEERLANLEQRIQQVEERLPPRAVATSHPKRGWQWFVGIFADSPDFEDVVRIGKEWREADQPIDENSGT